MEPMTYKERIKAINEFRETVINDISTLRKESMANLDNAKLAGDYHESHRLNTEVMAYTNVLNILKTY